MTKSFLTVATILGMLAVGSLIVAIGMRLGSDGEIPVISEVRPFQLTGQTGESFTEANLEDKVTVMDFFFTQCTGLCPRLSKEMTLLQKRFARLEDFQLVSVSVDPNNDTPDNIAEFIKLHGIDTRNWDLLTGDEETVRQLMVEDLKLPMVKDPRLHADRLVLLDRNLNVRGSYSLSNPAAMKRLPRDVRRLIKE
ncbi:MAG: SCO family protein [Opitutales bacterium]